MVFATREEEIDYLRDELERAGYDESSQKQWDEATLGRVRKLDVMDHLVPSCHNKRFPELHAMFRELMRLRDPAFRYNAIQVNATQVNATQVSQSHTNA